MPTFTPTPADVVASAAALFVDPPVINALKVVPTQTIAGEDIDAGELVAYHATDENYQLADSNDADLWEVKGIAANSAKEGQPISLVKEDPEIAVGGSDAAGTLFRSSTTPGAMARGTDAPVTGEKVCFIGISDGAGNMNLKLVQTTVATV